MDYTTNDSVCQDFTALKIVVSLSDGYDTPAEGHLAESSKKDLTEEVVSGKLKIGLAVQDRKEVGEKTILGDDFIERKSEKEEVPVCQIVTTS